MGDEVPESESDPVLANLAAEQSLRPGTVVGEYRLEDEIGSGGMGVVYAGLQPVIGKRVAIKVLKRLTGYEEYVHRFVREAQAVNRIGHPNIIDIFSFGKLPPPDGRHYFVMELLEGETLAARLARGPLDAHELRRTFRQTLAALSAAHRERIVHRDLKPENLWLAKPRHGEPLVKLLDFGIAKLLGDDKGSRVGVAIGTPEYMSPEQCQGIDVDHRTDIYAVGVILYLVFAGRLPFEPGPFLQVGQERMTTPAPPPSKWKPVHPAIERLILDCLAIDPRERPQSAEELSRRLDSAFDEAFATATQVDRSPMQLGVGPGTDDQTRGGSRPRSIARFAAFLGIPAAGALLGWLAITRFMATVGPTPVDVARAMTKTGEPLFPEACVTRDRPTRKSILAALNAPGTARAEGAWKAVPPQAFERRLTEARSASLSPEVAQRELEALATACPQSAVTQNLLGSALARQDRNADAEVRFLTASKLAPSYAAPPHNLGVLLVKQDRASDAIPWLDKVINLEPDHLTARLVRGQARLLAGDTGGAIADLRLHTSRNPKEGPAWLLLAQALDRLGDAAGARAAACNAYEVGLIQARDICRKPR